MKDLQLNQDIYGALLSLQGFILNEIAKHDALGDQYSANHWRQYHAKIAFLEADHCAKNMGYKFTPKLEPVAA